jgi:hypothetical protein
MIDWLIVVVYIIVGFKSMIIAIETAKYPQKPLFAFLDAFCQTSYLVQVQLENTTGSTIGRTMKHTVQVVHIFYCLLLATAVRP